MQLTLCNTLLVPRPSPQLFFRPLMANKLLCIGWMNFGAETQSKTLPAFSIERLIQSKGCQDRLHVSE